MDRLKGILLNGHMSYMRWHAAQQFGVPLRGRVLSIALFERDDKFACRSAIQICPAAIFDRKWREPSLPRY